MEKALRYELNKIPELTNKIYPTNAPEGEKGPYLVYITKKTPGKDLNGITKDRKSYVMLNVLSNTYSSMKDITKKVEDLIITFPLRIIGESGPYIEDLTIDEISETYESELKLLRGIIPFTICYKEE
jgi:hypothetical protein